MTGPLGNADKPMVAHEVILASAGCGKTFALTTRVIQLMCLGVSPPRIIALTFSRKAAGEIYDTLVQRLACAAESDERSRELVRQLELSGVSRADLLGVLRNFLFQMHLSPIGTLDSFFVRVLRTFPFEFGITGDFGIMDEQFLGVEQNAVFRHLLQPRHGGAAPQSRSQFLEAFKRATFGKEEKRLQDLLAEFTDAYHEAFLTAADGRLWGAPDRIWPAGSEWFADAAGDPAREVAAVRKQLAPLELTPRQRDKWDAFLALAGDFSPRSLIGGPGKDILVKLLDVTEDLRRGKVTVTVYSRMELGPDLCRPLHALISRVVASVLKAQMESTKGLFDVLDSYERAYDRVFRRAGRLTFADIQLLLARGAGEDNGPLRCSSEDEEWRRYVDYRLDGFYDHWALDEFQDTSLRQWQAIRNLVDEVLQDSSGRRTFFAVADVKQAIHGWRGGEASLLEEVLEAYNRHEKRIGTRPLAQSWRSCPAVIETVNRVFEPAQLSGVPGLPERVVDRWRLHWETHSSAPPVAAGNGYGALVRALPAPGNTKAEAGDRYAAMAGLIRTIDPVGRGLSAAVLVRSNKTGRAVVEYLRGQGVPAAWAGDFSIADNPVVAAVLSLFKAAEHPGDSLAWEHLRMTPFSAFLPSPGPEARSLLSLEVLGDVCSLGFEQTVDKWLNRLCSHLELDAFSLRRMDELAVAAQVFDSTGNKSLLDFVTFVRERRLSDVGHGHAVQVMTIHKSKGLGFDVVFLPDLQYGGITSSGQLGLAVEREEGVHRQAKWVLSMPPRAIAMADPVLREHVVRRDEAGCFEELCLLYVALTRAKRGLYIVVTAPGPSSRAVHLSTVLEHALTGTPVGATVETRDVEILYASGSADWFEALRPTSDENDAEAVAIICPCPPGAHAARKRLRRRIPSRERGTVRRAADLFLPAGGTAREEGTAIHALFREIEWLDADVGEAAVARWRAVSAAAPEVAAVAENAFRRALGTPEIRAVLTRPAEAKVELWRERSFEIVADGEWTSGVFDRVVIVLDEQGRARAATVYDFKTTPCRDGDDVAALLDRYRSQMLDYRRALARMLALPESEVRAALILTDPGRLLEY